MCDDGLQLLSKEDADERRRFYFDNNIAYVARPGHNVDGFVRKGRFKKAGNMNFTNALSLRVEEVMDELRPLGQANRPADHFWSENDENAVYDKALEQVLQERQGKAWAAGNIRIGPYILLIDSDTRVPEDCFADAVSEMAESPEVAIIQHMSGVMQVAHHFFENGVAHFTWSIQHAISYCCASGEGESSRARCTVGKERTLILSQSHRLSDTTPSFAGQRCKSACSSTRTTESIRSGQRITYRRTLRSL